MRNLNFIPYWYNQKRKNKSKRILSIVLVLVLILDIFLLYRCVFHIRKYNDILSKIIVNINTVSLMKKDELKKVNPGGEMNKSIDLFEDLIEGKVKYSGAEISNKEIYLQVPIKDNKALSDTIDFLDNTKGIEIVSAESESTNIYSEKNFRIELRVK